MRHFRRPGQSLVAARNSACGLFSGTTVCTTDPEKVECKRCLKWLVRAGQIAEGKLRAAEDADHG